MHARRPTTAAPSVRLDLDALLGGAAPDRLTGLSVAYLLLPTLIFLCGWAAVWVAVPATAAGIWLLISAPGGLAGWRASPAIGGKTAAACLALGFAWASLSGMHHLLHSLADWQIRDAVLRDLVRYAWPLTYRLPEGEDLLRAPLGYYLPAALAGKLGGVAVAQAALWAWTGLGIALVFALLRSLVPGGGKAFAIAAGVFVLFGGLQFGALFAWDALRGIDPTGRWGTSIEWWAKLFQYSSHMTLVLWVPNHVLPAWLATLLLLRHAHNTEFYAGAMTLLSAALFWGPVSTAGAAILYAFGWARLALGADRAAAFRAAVSLRNVVAALVLTIPVTVYILVDTSGIRSGFLFDLAPVAEAAPHYAAFLLVEVLPWAVLAVLLLRSGFLIAATAVLCVLPLYIFGPGNEMTMRGGIAPLTVLAVAAGIVLGLPRPVRGGAAQRTVQAVLAVCVAISAAGALNEASPIVTRPAWPLSRNCALPEAARQSVFQSTSWRHYLAPWPAPSLEPWLATPRERLVETKDVGPCWPPDTGVVLP